METSFGSAWWSVALPEPWEGEHDEDCATIAADPDCGALQLSAFKNEDEDVSDEDVQAFASEHVDGALALEPIIIGAFEGYRVTYEEEDGWWCEWFARCGRILLYVTYNCAIADREVEIADVDEILASLCCHEDADGDQLPDDVDGA